LRAFIATFEPAVYAAHKPTLGTAKWTTLFVAVSTAVDPTVIEAVRTALVASFKPAFITAHQQTEQPALCAAHDGSFRTTHECSVGTTDRATVE
jgi:hypothetical protein